MRNPLWEKPERISQMVEEPRINARRTDDLASSKSPRQSFSIRRWKNKSKSVFFGDMSIEKNTSQPASVESGRPLTRLCAQRAASPRKNACIFEKRVELFRHAQKSALGKARADFFTGQAGGAGCCCAAFGTGTGHRDTQWPPNWRWRPESRSPGPDSSG